MGRVQKSPRRSGGSRRQICGLVSTRRLPSTCAREAGRGRIHRQRQGTGPDRRPQAPFLSSALAAPFPIYKETDPTP